LRASVLAVLSIPCGRFGNQNMTNRIRNLSPENQPAAASLAALPSGMQGNNSFHAMQQIYAIAQQQAKVTIESRQWQALIRRLMECDED
jgi:hypothetical protein